MKIEQDHVVFSDPKLQAIFDDKKEHSAQLLDRVQATDKKMADRQEKSSSIPLAKDGTQVESWQSRKPISLTKNRNYTNDAAFG